MSILERINKSKYGQFVFLMNGTGYISPYQLNDVLQDWNTCGNSWWGIYTKIIDYITTYTYICCIHNLTMTFLKYHITVYIARRIVEFCSQGNNYTLKIILKYVVYKKWFTKTFELTYGICMNL